MKKEIMLSTPEVNKRIAEIEGKEFVRFNDPVKNKYYGDHVWIKAKFYCLTDGEYDSEDIFRPDTYALILKHEIARVHDPIAGFCYRAIEGDLTLMPVNVHGEHKAVCLAILAKFRKLTK